MMKRSMIVINIIQIDDIEFAPLDGIRPVFKTHSISSKKFELCPIEVTTKGVFNSLFL